MHARLYMRTCMPKHAHTHTYQASTQVDSNVTNLLRVGLNELLHDGREVIILCLSYHHQQLWKWIGREGWAHSFRLLPLSPSSHSHPLYTHPPPHFRILFSQLTVTPPPLPPSSLLLSTLHLHVSLFILSVSPPSPPSSPLSTHLG